MRRQRIFAGVFLTLTFLVVSACSAPAAAPTSPALTPTTTTLMPPTPEAMPHTPEAKSQTPDTMMEHTPEVMTQTPEAMPHTPEAMPHTPGAMAHPVWKQLATEGGPSARYDHTIFFDPDQQHLILFGGRSESQAAFGNTWIYDVKTNAWREIKTAGPHSRFGHGAIYDPARKAMFIFGGQAGDLFNDTWAFDTAKETWSEVKTGDPKPDVRYGLGAAFDATRERLIVSHGFAKDGRHDDTWALDLKSNKWTNITPSGDRPLKRCLLETAYAAPGDAMYLFGGCSSGFGPCPQGDLWSLDLKANKWMQVRPTGETPSARQNPALVFDTHTNRLILFGGNGGGPLNDLWIFDPAQNAWTKLALEGPSARKSHDAVHDELNHRVFVFGGATANGASNELWELDL